MCDEDVTCPCNIDLSSSVPVSEKQWPQGRQAINKCADHATNMFSLLEVKITTPFSMRLNTREGLMKQVIQFTPRTFTHDDMKGSIVVEKEEDEENETNQDKYEKIVENLKKCVEEINRNDEEETDRVEDDFEIDINVTDADKEDEIVRIDDKNGKEEQK